PTRRQIVLIPDIQHEYYPEFFDKVVLKERRVAFTDALVGAGAIATISEYARKTLREQPCTRCQDIFLMTPALLEEHRQVARAALLRLLRQRARALAFFSLYEGFGMPLLEAFDAGTPVICSNTTSLPEVGGDAVLSCDPKNIAGMAALMERITREEGLRAELV